MKRNLFDAKNPEGGDVPWGRGNSGVGGVAL